MDDPYMDEERPCYQRQQEECERREQEDREHQQEMKQRLRKWLEQFNPKEQVA